MNREEWRGDSPVGLRRFGKEFITVGQDALEAHRRRDPPTLLDQHLGQMAPDAIYYNFLHGIELSLKSYLRHVDAVSLKDLRSRSYGHNLCRLLDCSIQNNLLTKCPKLEKVHIDTIRFSSEIYSRKEFEYIRIGLVQYPDIDLVFEAADTLITELIKLPMQLAKNPVRRPDRRA